ncbi:MAG: thioesterase family protein [Flavobacteriales bacterium]|nr:thioesterase family protein [Flavobacteriales bacterium]
MTNDQGVFRSRINLRWADIDANFHLRHSVFYDLCAQQRMDALTTLGIGMAQMKEHHFGPVLFREECTFRREIKLDDEVYLELRLRYVSADHARFSFEHEFLKADGTHCARMVVEGAWMDTRLRKLCAPPEHLLVALDHLPRSAEFKTL